MMTAFMAVISRLIFFPVFFSLFSCGYGFVALQDRLPGGVRRVAIPTFENRTHEAGLENIFTADLRNEFFKSKIIEVVSTNGEAQIFGTITGLSIESLAHSEKDLVGRSSKILVNTYVAKVDISVSLVKRADKTVLWERTFSDTRQYVTGDDLLKNEVKQQEAFKKISLYIAEQAHDMMLEDF